MRHYPVQSGTNRHYAVGHNGIGGVLIQLGEDISIEPFHCQVRVCLTVKEADEMIELLQKARAKAAQYEGSQQATTREEESLVLPGVQRGDGQGQEALPDVQA